jgi:ABC-type methionine transport system permease subunit
MIVTMINSSAIAGAIGAGGLGDIAYRYGYQRFDMQIQIICLRLQPMACAASIKP